MHSPGKLLEAYLAVHLVTVANMVLETSSFCFETFIFLLLARKEESENDGLEDKYYLRQGEPVPGMAPEACAPFLWRMGAFFISNVDEALASFPEMKYFFHHV